MSPEEHYAKAEELLELAANDECPERHFQDREWLTARAQAHATLALFSPEVSINVQNPFTEVAATPAETGPWQTWQEVPEGVVYTSSRTPWHRWKNVKGERRHKMAAFSDGSWGMSGAHEQTMAERAPFVAAEKEEA